MNGDGGFVVPSWIAEAIATMLKQHGWDDHTDEQKAERLAASVARQERIKERRREMWAALDSLPSPLREVAQLHRPVDGWREENQADPANAVCDGCDMAGYEAEQPGWPCRTAVMVADLAGIDTTETSRW